jgi:CheY-specific phosphatase CheX
MSNTTDHLLQQATASTFEELAFLFLESECTEEQAAAPLDAIVMVNFHGPVHGRLTLRTSSTLLPAIAANMLGEEQAKFVPLQRDALGEVANVVCGNLLPLVAGAEAVFRLDAPQWMSAADAVTRDGDAPVASVTCGVEDGRVCTELFVFGGQAALVSVMAEGAAA